MACPLCPTAGWFGGWLGGFLGINSPDIPEGKILSAVITANLIGITVIALKAIFNISLCIDGRFTLKNIALVGVKTLCMGIIYSIGVNYLLNRYLFSQRDDLKQEGDFIRGESLLEECGRTPPPPCCCKSKECLTDRK